MKNLLQILLRSPKFVLGLILMFILIVFIFLYPLLNRKNPAEIVTMSFEAPSAEHPLGSDNFGRDVLLELAHGAKASLHVGILAGLIATSIGLLIGLFAGYVGGIADNILTTINNMFIVIPPLIILILLSISLNTRTTELVGLIIGITSWPWTARAVRAQTSSLRFREHVNIAKISGYSTPRIIITQVLPYIASYVFMALILQTASGILQEASISMLGLGPYDTISLGTMLNWAVMFEALGTGSWWAFIPPALIIAIFTFSLFIMNSGMDEIFNPKIRR